ncbi:MAG: N(4)-(beta-N-acetylglucosaminyl)-L-asparaginase [Acidobacteria bacterium]|nr:N(4)-(beta-N-acetylglucosaminyl)-L-asparaginase [Acidobacteriota bacterium]MBI3472255.1 N(4)-(beta-N-acetylglucosaminyl)-L-asparaginase [Candidatus Solibacter usitatus]
MITRRHWIAGGAALPAWTAAGAAAPRNIVVSSENGLRACARAMEMIQAGKDTLEAVIAGVNINEEDPEDNSVGYGGLPNEEGVVELDASVMHGPTRRAGSVASIRNIKTPSKVARLVMEQTDHVMLVGEGALRFAKAVGLHEENLLTEKSRLAWLVWKQSLRDPKGHNNWTDGLDAPGPAKPSARLRQLFPAADEQTLAWAWEQAVNPTTGTINCLALNTRGEMSGVTTTSGLAWKIPGRVGDSPIIGAGLYVDQDVGAAGSTGRGEENIRVAGAHSIVENMRHGMPPKEACLEVLKRVARNFNGDRAKLEQFDLSFYALRKDGEYAGASLWSGGLRNGKVTRKRFCVNDGGKSRHEECVFLLERTS